MSPKLLAFYASTLALVVVLFHTVTDYGETNLKPAPNINGLYVSTTAYPSCPEASRLGVEIQQSGIYLRGAIAIQSATAQSATAQSATAQSATAQPEAVLAKSRYTLSGRWKNQTITLAGTRPILAGCAIQPAADQPMQIVGTLTTDASMLNAEVRTAAGQPWRFTAQRQVQPKQVRSH
jgi:hypothetical protein